MTPRTLNELIDAKQKERDDKMQILDLMNAKVCHLVALSGHIKNDGKDPKPADFLILKREPENKTMVFDTPEQIALKMSMI